MRGLYRKGLVFQFGCYHKKVVVYPTLILQFLFSIGCDGFGRVWVALPGLCLRPWRIGLRPYTVNLHIICWRALTQTKYLVFMHNALYSFQNNAPIWKLSSMKKKRLLSDQMGKEGPGKFTL